MFVCKERCVEKYEGPSVDWAKSMDRVSLGPCEFCGEVGHCLDIPSSGNWGPKKPRVIDRRTGKPGPTLDE